MIVERIQKAYTNRYKETGKTPEYLYLDTRNYGDLLEATGYTYPAVVNGKGEYMGMKVFIVADLSNHLKVF